MSATTPLQLLCLASEERAVQDLSSNADKLIADPTYGTAIPLAIANVLQIAVPTGSRTFTPQSWAGWGDPKVSLGNGPIPPVAGVWYLLSDIPLTSGTVTTSKRFKIITFVSGDDFTNIGAASNATGIVFTATNTTPTTWTHGSELQEITADLPYNATATQVQTALNNTAFITAHGGVAVTDDVFYFVTWNLVGDRASLVGFAGELAPLSIIEVSTLEDGSTITEVQIIRVIQNAASFVVCSTDSDAATVNVDEVQTGGAGLNAKYRITLTADPYDGAFSLVVQGLESAMVQYNASEDELQTALEAISINHGTLVSGAKYKIISFVTGDDFTNVGALSNATGVVFVASGTTPTTWTNLSILSPVGAGNVQVSKEADGQYFAAFTGDMANTDMGTITGDPSGLQATPYKLGTLNLDTPGVALLLGSEQTVLTFIVITAIPPGETYPREIFRRQVTLNQAIAFPGYTSPQPNDEFFTTTQSDARYLRKNASSALAAGFSLIISNTASVEWFSGALLQVDAGATATFNGSLGGTPTGGTLNLSAVTLTVANAFWNSPSSSIGSGTPVATTGTTITATIQLVLPNGSSGTPAIKFSSANGIYANNTGTVIIVVGNATAEIFCSATGIAVPSGGFLSFGLTNAQVGNNGNNIKLLGGNTQAGTLEISDTAAAISVDVVTAAGKTLKVTSGTNAKSGTFTLVAGVATVANTSVTANSVIVVTLKTLGGTRTGNPDIVPTATTGFVASGGVADTSTYNYIILEVA